MTPEPSAEPRYPLQPLEFRLLIPPEIDFTHAARPGLAPPDVAFRIARHRFMYSLFVVAPWSAFSCVQDLLPAYLEALRTQDIWTNVLRLVLARRAAPDASQVPSLGSPLTVARDTLCLDSYARAWDAFDDLPDCVQAACMKILAWGQFFHLTELWCLDWVLEQMYRWAAILVDLFLEALPQREEKEVLESGLLINRPSPLVPGNAVVLEQSYQHETAPIWEPHREQMVAAEQRALAHFQASLRARLKEMAATLEARGWEPVPHLENAQHFEWLVRYQCNEESFSGIAREMFRARQTVSEPVRELAKYLALPLRPPGGGGRPPGAKDKTSRRRAR